MERCVDNTILWDDNLEEREDHQGEMQGGTMSLANTNHTTEQHSDKLKAKGQENGGNTKKPADITHALERDNTSKTREMDAVGDAPQLGRLAHGPSLLQLLVFNVQDQRGVQGGATNLLNTSHATDMYSDILKSKELGDGNETKKITDTAPNTTDLKKVNHRQPFLPTGGES